VRSEGLGQLKSLMTTSGIEPATFLACRIVPQPTTIPRAPLVDGSFIKFGSSAMIIAWNYEYVTDYHYYQHFSAKNIIRYRF
jgi:hypothetical protein